MHESTIAAEERKGEPMCVHDQKSRRRKRVFAHAFMLPETVCDRYCRLQYLAAFRRTAKRFAARSIRAVTASPAGKSGRPSAPIVQSLTCVPAWMRCVFESVNEAFDEPSRPARTVNMNTALSSPTTWNISPAGNCGAWSGAMAKSACTSLRRSARRAQSELRLRCGE